MSLSRIQNAFFFYGAYLYPVFAYFRAEHINEEGHKLYHVILTYIIRPYLHLPPLSFAVSQHLFSH